jgi:hypothetical protein
MTRTTRVPVQRRPCTYEATASISSSESSAATSRIIWLASVARAPALVGAQLVRHVNRMLAPDRRVVCERVAAAGWGHGRPRRRSRRCSTLPAAVDAAGPAATLEGSVSPPLAPSGTRKTPRGRPCPRRRGSSPSATSGRSVRSPALNSLQLAARCNPRAVRRCSATRDSGCCRRRRGRRMQVADLSLAGFLGSGRRASGRCNRGRPPSRQGGDELRGHSEPLRRTEGEATGRIVH